MATVESATKGCSGPTEGLNEERANFIVTHHAGCLIVDGDKRLVAAVGLFAGNAGGHLATVARVVEVELVPPSGTSDKPTKGGGDVCAGWPDVGQPVVGHVEGAGPNAIVKHTDLVVLKCGADRAHISNVVDTAGQLSGLTAVVDPDEEGFFAWATHVTQTPVLLNAFISKNRALYLKIAHLYRNRARCLEDQRFIRRSGTFKGC